MLSWKAESIHWNKNFEERKLHTLDLVQQKGKKLKNGKNLVKRTYSESFRFIQNLVFLSCFKSLLLDLSLSLDLWMGPFTVSPSSSRKYTELRAKQVYQLRQDQTGMFSIKTQTSAGEKSRWYFVNLFWQKSCCSKKETFVAERHNGVGKYRGQYCCFRLTAGEWTGRSNRNLSVFDYHRDLLNAVG